MRKEILGSDGRGGKAAGDELAVAELARVQVSSELAEHPVEHAFDGRRGPGGSRWVAETPGEQTLVLVFDAPQAVRTVALEIEEKEESRTQELQLAVSRDGGKSYQEIVRQEFNFAPSGATFEREEWQVGGEPVTHLRLQIKPDKGSSRRRVSLTSLVLR